MIALRTLVLASIAAASLAIAGCTPGTDRVCTREANLTAEKLTKRGLMVTDDDKKLLIEHCTTRLERIKSDSSDRYKCEAKCVMDSVDIDGVEACNKTCTP